MSTRLVVAALLCLLIVGLPWFAADGDEAEMEAAENDTTGE